MGTVKEGCGGLSEQIPYQGLDPQCKADRFLHLSIPPSSLACPYSDHHQDQTIVTVMLFALMVLQDTGIV